MVFHTVTLVLALWWPEHVAGNSNLLHGSYSSIIDILATKLFSHVMFQRGFNDVSVLGGMQLDETSIDALVGGRGSQPT